MDKKAMKKAFKEKELNDFRESLPMPETDFPSLFDFLDEELEKVECANDTSLLELYCKRQNLDFLALKNWFREHGGYCDCEILNNVEERFYYLDKPIISNIEKKKGITSKQTKLDDLKTDFGFSINKVPSPWKLVSIEKNGKIDYQFTIGKKSYFRLMLEKDFPIDRLSDDIFLHDRWKSQLEWDDFNDLEFQIDRHTINNFQIMQVGTKRWVPVLIFVFKPSFRWCLVMNTESVRVRNDMKDIEKL